MNRVRVISMIGVGLVFGALLYFFVLGVVGPGTVVNGDEKGIWYEYAHDGDEADGKNHFVWLRAGCDDGRIKNVRTFYRGEGDQDYGGLEMIRIGGGGVFAGELPAREKGKSTFFYFAVEREPDSEVDRSGDPRGGAGPVVTIPSGAPDTGRPFRVRARGASPPWIMAFHIVLTSLAPLFLIHAAFYVVLFLSGRFENRGEGRRALRAAHLNVLIAFAVFLIGAVPLGIMVNQSRFGSGWEGWPAGCNATHTLSGLVLVVLASLLAWRYDLFPAKGAERPRSDKIYGILFFAVFALIVAAFGLSHVLPKS